MKVSLPPYLVKLDKQQNRNFAFTIRDLKSQGSQVGWILMRNSLLEEQVGLWTDTILAEHG